jgi:diguanylate cyclase (GGDEF)-like protein
MSLTEKHLLIVDDSTINIELMFDLLDEYGFENIHGINDPREVLRHCQQQLPDLLLLDIRMPHLDGYAVIDQLKRHFAERMPPIIVLTSQIDNATRQRALAMGVRDFITKPFRQDEVLQRIRNTLDIEHRYQVRDKEADSLELMVAKRTQELDHQSRTDPITQLPNRRGLNQALRTAALEASGTGLLFIAIDKLDDVVRLHGYRVADELLHSISQRLRHQLDEACLLGLWGGSELLAIIPTANPTKLMRQAEDLLQCFEQDQALEELLLPLSARIGISAEAGYFETQRLVHKAALALPPLESLKVQCYTAALETKQRHRLHIQQAIRGATERGEMSLAFQPKLSLADHKILGAEALLRWQHPEFGVISPGEFIPLAEASGDILAIGDWVLTEAMRHINVWRAQSLLNDDFHIAVNVAARQLTRKDFAQQLLARLEEQQIPQRFFALEVTESGLMSDMNQAREQLAQLSQMDIAVAIDDFGTGQSSLAYIKTLPFSTLKIDRAFVMDLETSAIDRQLATTITQLAHSVGCDVVAEGIETSGQAAYLSSIGCEAAQGYFYTRPLPAEEFVTWCTEWKPLFSTTHREAVNGS